MDSYQYSFENLVPLQKEEKNEVYKHLDYNIYINDYSDSKYSLSIVDRYNQREVFKRYPISKENILDRIEEALNSYRKSKCNIIDLTNERVYKNTIGSK